MHVSRIRFIRIIALLSIMTALFMAFTQNLFAKAPVVLRFLAANHPFTDVIKPLIPEFEKKYNIKVNVENYEENQLTQKLMVEFTSNASTIDVFMTRPLQEGRLFNKNNWYEPLNTTTLSYCHHTPSVV